MCIDPHEEARDAWAAIIKAHYPPEAVKAAFQDVSAVDYNEAKGRITDALRNPDKLVETRLTAQLTIGFQEQYRHAEELAEAGK